MLDQDVTSPSVYITVPLYLIIAFRSCTVRCQC